MDWRMWVEETIYRAIHSQVSVCDVFVAVWYERPQLPTRSDPEGRLGGSSVPAVSLCQRQLTSTRLDADDTAAPGCYQWQRDDRPQPGLFTPHCFILPVWLEDSWLGLGTSQIDHNQQRWIVLKCVCNTRLCLYEVPVQWRFGNANIFFKLARPDIARGN